MKTGSRTKSPALFFPILQHDLRRLVSVPAYRHMEVIDGRNRALATRQCALILLILLALAAWPHARASVTPDALSMMMKAAHAAHDGGGSPACHRGAVKLVCAVACCATQPASPLIASLVSLDAPKLRSEPHFRHPNGHATLPATPPPKA